MLLQIKRLALRPLPRLFGPLRKVELEHPGAGYLITCPPDPVASQVLHKQPQYAQHSYVWW